MFSLLGDGSVALSDLVLIFLCSSRTIGSIDTGDSFEISFCVVQLLEPLSFHPHVLKDAVIRSHARGVPVAFIAQ